MGVADGDGERIGGVWPCDVDAGELDADHVADLAFVGMADAHNRFLDRVGGVFADAESCPGGGEHGDAASLAKLQGACPVLVHKGLFDSRRVGCVCRDDGADLVKEAEEAQGQVIARRVADTVGDMAQTRAIGVNDAPSHVAQAGVDAQNSHDVPPSPECISLFSWRSTKGEHPPRVNARARFATCVLSVFDIARSAWSIWDDTSG
ncbi:hypothetical protein RA29_07220 [Tateyamaria sp. ANG-S1]|nr:hypothetical protein RA29_07220 [Tateyamaria sp. ANG-S1]